jgi:hypothetical protein
MIRNDRQPLEQPAAFPVAGLFTLGGLFNLIMIISSIIGAINTANTWRQVEDANKYQQAAAAAVARGEEPPMAAVMPPDISQWWNTLAPFVLAGASWVATNYFKVDPKTLPIPSPIPFPSPLPGPAPSPVPSPELTGNLKILQALDTLTSTLAGDAKDTVIDLRIRWGGQSYKVFFGPDVDAAKAVK